MPNRFRYRQWDGTQDIAELDADDILKSLSDDLLNFGDLQQALRSMMQRGVRSPDGDRSDGLRDLLQRLRQQRREALDRFDLTSVFDDIQRQLDEILDLERGTLDERLDEVGPRPQPPQPAEGDQPAGEQTGEQQTGEQQTGEHRLASRGRLNRASSSRCSRVARSKNRAA